MNKKSAIATAGGLVASFVAGVAAVSFNWGLTRPTTASQAASATSPAPAKVEPIIKHRTITIHKKAPTHESPSASGSRTVVLAAPPAPATATAPVATTSASPVSGGESDGGEREGGDD